jgi:hypothetical protein
MDMGPTSNPDHPFFIGAAILTILIAGFVVWVIREFKDE